MSETSKKEEKERTQGRRRGAGVRRKVLDAVLDAIGARARGAAEKRVALRRPSNWRSSPARAASVEAELKLDRETFTRRLQSARAALRDSAVCKPGRTRATDGFRAGTALASWRARRHRVGRTRGARWRPSAFGRVRGVSRPSASRWRLSSSPPRRRGARAARHHRVRPPRPRRGPGAWPRHWPARAAETLFDAFVIEGERVYSGHATTRRRDDDTSERRIVRRSRGRRSKTETIAGPPRGRAAVVDVDALALVGRAWLPRTVRSRARRLVGRPRARARATRTGTRARSRRARRPATRRKPGRRKPGIARAHARRRRRGLPATCDRGRAAPRATPVGSAREPWRPPGGVVR